MTEDPRRLAAIIDAQERVAAAGLDVDAVLGALAEHAAALAGAEGAAAALLGSAGEVEREVVAGAPPSDGASLLTAPLDAGDGPSGTLTAAAAPGRRFAREDREAVTTLARFGARQLAHASRLARAERESRTDPLTGLGNRRALDEALRRELHRRERYGRPLSVVLVDLDGFKRVNDEHGHAAGDEVLARVAGRLGALRGADSAFRLGGDEFAVLLPETALDAAELAARRVCRLIGTDLRLYAVGASWGTAEASGTAPGEVLAAADGRLYARKRAGGRPGAGSPGPSGVA